MDNTRGSARWDTVIRPRKGWFDIDFKGLVRYRDLIWLMVKRNFTVLYKQTILGPAWVVIQPLLTTLVFTVVFGNLAGLPTDGVPKFLFYMAGNIMWHFFSQCLTVTSETFTKNSKLFGKVYFPRLVMPFSTVLTEMINFAVQFVLFIVFVVIQVAAVACSAVVALCRSCHGAVYGMASGGRRNDAQSAAPVVGSQQYGVVWPSVLCYGMAADASWQCQYGYPCGAWLIGCIFVFDSFTVCYIFGIKRRK